MTVHPLMLLPGGRRSDDQPSSCISQHISNLIEGDHDITQFDTPTVPSNIAGHPYYDPTRNPQLYVAQTRANYILALTVLHTTLFQVGEIEHTNDWDWWVGVTLRDGTRLGDGYHVGNYPDYKERKGYPGTTQADPEWDQRYEAASKLDDDTGYCDTWHYHCVPTTDDYELVLEMHPGTDENADQTLDGISIPFADIATITISER